MLLALVAALEDLVQHLHSELPQHLPLVPLLLPPLELPLLLHSAPPLLPIPLVLPLRPHLDPQALELPLHLEEASLAPPPLLPLELSQPLLSEAQLLVPRLLP